MKYLNTTILISASLIALGSLNHSAQPFSRTQAGATQGTGSPNRFRIVTSFDADWRFLRADAPGAEATDFNDAPWRRLDVPHDWSIEGPFDERNPAGGTGGFLQTGIGWYRKHFTVPSLSQGKRVFIEFDGVMANSSVWINGALLGTRPYGYVGFGYELTGHIDFGNKANVLAVRVDNSRQPASRWYSGAGIYRHVRLVVTNPVHIEQWGTFVSTPQVATDMATVRVGTTIVNQANSPARVAIGFTLIDPDGRPAGTAQTSPQTVPAGGSAAFSQDIAVTRPQLWDIDRPVLYRAVTRVLSGATTIDDESTSFGIREFHFDSTSGFWLNGRNFKLKGVCLHHDAGALGAAVPLRAWERRLVLLKQMGVNAIRTAHNPPSPDFLDLCDRIGLLVMDEMFDCWTVAKNPYDYHLYFNEWSRIDTRDIVRRDRNHPSIVLYSAGNEIRDTPNTDLARKILKGLVDVFHEFDPTRPVTQALFRPNVSHDYDNGLAELLDVVGTNYRDQELLAAHQVRPDRKIVGTEQGHDLKTWLACRDNPAHAGQFLWTGIDYLGESRRWPVIAAGSGLLDRTGAPKPMAYERESWWAGQPVVHVVRRREEAAQTTAADPGYEPLTRRQSQFADWTPRNASPHNENIEAYSNCDEVELVINGKSLGSRAATADGSPRKWTVPYEPGTLKAIARNKGQVVATDQLRTAGKPSRILLSPDRSRLSLEWEDVSYITATVVDGDGVLIPYATDLISFKTAGPGVIVAVDNGDNSSHEPFQASERHAFQGRCVAIIRATHSSGRITVTASSPGLSGSSISISSLGKAEQTIKSR
jgi:beta-galactosidase